MTDASRGLGSGASSFGADSLRHRREAVDPRAVASVRRGLRVRQKGGHSAADGGPGWPQNGYGGDVGGLWEPWRKPRERGRRPTGGLRARWQPGGHRRLPNQKGWKGPKMPPDFSNRPRQNGKTPRHFFKMPRRFRILPRQMGETPGCFFETPWRFRILPRRWEKTP